MTDREQRGYRFAWLAMLTWLAACADKSESTPVRVLSDGQRCVVASREMPCDAVGRYLRDTLQIPRKQLISVSIDETGPLEERGRRIKDALTNVGYSHIIVVGFISEPRGH